MRPDLRDAQEREETYFTQASEELAEMLGVDELDLAFLSVTERTHGSTNVVAML